MAAVWGGLALAYTVASIPPSSAIIGLAGLACVLAAVVARVGASRPGERSGRESRPAGSPEA